MSSTSYRDGCSGRVMSLSWVLVQLVSFAAWLIPPRGKHRRP